LRLREKRWRKHAFLALFERRIVRDAAALQVLTAEERGQVVGAGGDASKCVVIPNASEIDPDGPFPDGSRFRRHAGLEPGAELVLFMSRLHRIKGLDLLVEGFARARAAAPGARLVIAGPDEGERANLEARVRRLGIQDAVRFVGPLDGDLRLAALRAADVFALTSRSEGMPNAVLEACAAGAPVLITPGCNLPEVARAGAGRIVEPEPAAIGQALAAMLADADGRRRMGGNGRALVRRSFSVGAVAALVERMYAEVAERAQAAAGAAAVNR
jgi:glycosyltransferase involved in cell wall biosynthesis